MGERPDISSSSSSVKETVEDITQSLYESTLERDWDKVVEFYQKHPEIHRARITKKEDIALHVAITHGSEETIQKLLDEIDKTNYEEMRKALEAKNMQGNTPLHNAAQCGLKDICERMLHVTPLLVGDRNNDGETPLFLAALHGHTETFLCLHRVCINIFQGRLSPPWRRNKDGDTILHCAIRREHFDLAFVIMALYEEQGITSSVNVKGITALHLLASKPSAFLSSNRLRWWTRILYHGIIVEPPKVTARADQRDLAQVKVIRPEDSQTQTSAVETKKAAEDVPKNYYTCLEFFGMFYAVIKSVYEMIHRRDSHSPTPDYQNQYFPPNYATVRDLIEYSCRFFLILLGYGLLRLKNMKQKHVLCAQMIDELVRHHSEYTYGYSFRPEGMGPFPDKQELDAVYDPRKKNKQEAEYSPTSMAGVEQKPQEGKENQSAPDPTLTPLLMAAKNGAIELVKKILDEIPMAMEDVTAENKNILHVAVENRQPHIFMAIKNYKIYDSLVEEVDVDGNNVLHLAAKESKYKPWRIPGAAMQLQWEIKWYQFIKESAPRHLIFQANEEDKTPEQIFTESHKELVKEGSEWLKSTSESCSVVAALIAGVSFATASTVPGGNDSAGKPNLEGRPAFDLFAITSLVALCFSVTALVMFLAILTSRQQPKDFRRDLPFKLLLGLSSLFVSIAAILVSFCAGHFFEIANRLNRVVFIIYAATCLPVTFYAVAQLPLYLDLLESILAKVPHPSYKDDDL